MKRPPTIIRGRPDLEDHGFGVTYAKKFPPYVFSTNGNAKLVHRIYALQLRWWEPGPGGSYLVRRSRPHMIARSICGQAFHFAEDRRRSQLCVLPNPDAVLCGRCHGEPPPFGYGATDGLSVGEARTAKREAHRRLGCIVEAD